MGSLRTHRAFAGPLAVGGAARLAWIAFAAREPAGLHDPFSYLAGARTLAAGDGYLAPFRNLATAYFPPGYAAFLTPFAWLEQHVGVLRGDLPALAAFANLAAALAVIASTMLIGRAVAGDTAALVAGYTVALWPNLVFGTAVALSEQLFLALLLAAFALVATRPAGIARWAGAGALLGAAALVRPLAILAVPIVAFVVAGTARWRALATCFATCALVIVPWTVRNAVVMHAFVPISTNSSDDFCIGHHTDAGGGFALAEACNPTVRAAGVAREIERARAQQRIGLDYVRANPVHELHLAASRLRHTFAFDTDSLAASESYGDDHWLGHGVRTALVAVSNVAWWVAGPVGLAGLIVLARRTRRDAWLLAGAAVLTVLPTVVFFGDPRFKTPAVPFLAIGVGAVIAARTRRREPVPSEAW